MPDTAEILRKFTAPLPPGLPKYAQLREILFSAIREGHWRPGDKLPTEAELTRHTPFSLGTVQRALRALVDEGLVVRSQGSGTFVAEGPSPIDAPLHLRFLGGAGEPRYLPLFPKVLSRKRASLDGPWAEWLGADGGPIMRIDRTLSVNGEFSVYTRFYFRADTFPEISRGPLEGLTGVNLKQAVSAAAKMPVAAVRERIVSVRLDEAMCEAIGVKPGTRGMLLESAASAARGVPLYYLESFIPPTSRRLVVSAE